MEPSELNLLYVAIQNFREAMEGDLRLTDLDQISLENYISLLELTYIEWKRWNVQKPPSINTAYRFAA